MPRRRPQRDLTSLLVGGAAGAVGTSIVRGYHRTDAGRFVLPAYHEPGMRVPHGGSSCANCKYFTWDQNSEPHCWEPHFAAWNGGTRLPVDDPNDYCSDWWQPDAEAKAEIRRQR